MDSSQYLSLPPEIVLLVIDSLFPSRTNLAPTPIALPASHTLTHTLRSLALTCRLTYPPAIRSLYTRCVYVDSLWRLEALNRTVQAMIGRRHVKRSTSKTVINGQNQIPFVHRSELLSSIYLAPFGRNRDAPMPESRLVMDLLTSIRGTLKRLLLSVPYNAPLDWQFVSPLFRGALDNSLSSLSNLEVFCCMQGSLYGLLLNPANLNDQHILPWRWPNLRVLVLKFAYFRTSYIWDLLSQAESLERVVVILPFEIDEIDVKKKWKSLKHGGKKALEFILVNVESEQKTPLGEDPWRKEDQGVTLRQVNVPTSYYGDEDPMELCEEWVTRCMLRGDETV